MGAAVRQNPQAKLALFAKHGLVTWGQTGEESYTGTIEAINRAADFVAERGGGEAPFGGRKLTRPSPERQNDLLAAIQESPRARRTFETLNRANLFALAFRTNHMKTAAGRAKKIAALVAMLERGETIIPQRDKR